MLINNCNFDKMTNTGIWFDNFETVDEDYRLFIRVTNTDWNNSFNDKSNILRCDGHSHLYAELLSMSRNTAVSMNGIRVVFGTINVNFATNLYIENHNCYFYKNANPIYLTLCWPNAMTQIEDSHIE